MSVDMATMPKVSIVLPTYNGVRYLASALDSCLMQDYPDFELIVVVDGSRDETLELLNRYSDPRLLVYVTENRGHSNALNYGFKRASGFYWTWTSDDNNYLPGAIIAMVNVLQQNSGAHQVRTGYYKIDENGRRNGKSTYTYACFLYTAEAARKTGEYRHEFKEVNDIDFFTRMVYYFGLPILLNDYLYEFRFHSQSQTSRNSGKRELTSLKMHTTLVKEGFESLDLKAFYFEQASRAAIYPDYPTLDAMKAYAKSVQVPFYSEYEKYCKWLQTRYGWLVNRIKKVIWSRWFGLTLAVRRVFRLGYRSNANHA